MLNRQLSESKFFMILLFVSLSWSGSTNGESVVTLSKMLKLLALFFLGAAAAPQQKAIPEKFEISTSKPTENLYFVLSAR